MKGGRSWRPWRWVVPRDAEQEVDEEIGFHLEQRTRDYIARGMSPEAAREAAAQRFGDEARARAASASLLAAELAAQERLALWRVSSLDVKLGLRMFLKYPGLSAVAVIGMALAIAIGAGYFTFLGAMLESTLPLPEGEHVVLIRNQTVTGPDAGDTFGASARDFVQWRDEVQSIREIGAWGEGHRNLITADGRTELVRVAAITASGFRFARVEPMLGRTLLDEDERPGATLVLVIGYEEWQRRFDGDAQILGRTVRLNDTVQTIVGVMPPGFRFPVRHRYWVPIRLTDELQSEKARSSLHVFGRLTDGASLTHARAELSAIGERMATAFPQTHGTLRPQVLLYTHAFVGIQGPEMELAVRAVQVGVSLLLLIVAVNVAILVYARTATRMGEIAVRTALGASRARVVVQLFVEALVLSISAAVIGLTVLRVALSMIQANEAGSGEAESPFWVDFSISPAVILYVALLAIVAAAIIGVLPALNATGKRVQRGLQQFSSRGSGVQLGRTWTALIIVQIALAVAALPPAMYHGGEAFRLAARQRAAAASDLLRGRLTMSGEADEQKREARFVARMTTLIQRLEADPGVAGVTFAEQFPGEQERYATIEAETTLGAADEDQSLIRVRANRVATNFFEVFQAPILAGRGFSAADTRAGAPAVVVDQLLVERLGGGNVVGRRVRYSGSRDSDRPPSPWYEIVGVVPAFAAAFTIPYGFNSTNPRVYHAGAAGQSHPAALVVRVVPVGGSAPTRFSSTLREIATTVDPRLQLERLEGVVEAWENGQQFWRMFASGVIAVMASVLLLSAAGIYAMMSFTVARRRREIGIRAALGADVRHVLIGIFGRAATQLGLGTAAGLAVVGALEWLGASEITGGRTVVLIPGVVAVMFTVGLLAAFGPARRGLSVQPTEALRED